MKIVSVLLMLALAVPALADPKTKPQPKRPQLDKQNEAIDKGLQEAGEKADIAMSKRNTPSTKPESTGKTGKQR